MSTVSEAPQGLAAVLALLRPRHWVKNLFVLAGILFGHDWFDARLWQQVVLLFFGFSFTASAVYAFNDIADRARDRNHPRKRLRPVASGALSVRQAGMIGVASLALGLLLSWWASPQALALVVIYLFINLAYSGGLKHVVILDVFIIAIGFMLRILAGTIGIGIPASQWLLVCGFMLTLFLGFAKRQAELMALGEGQDHRQVLEEYTPQLLDLMLGVTAAATIMAYSLYTLSPQTVQAHGTSALIYTVPFVAYGIFRHLYLLHRRGRGDDPALDLLRDPQMLLTVLAWLLVTLWLIAAP
ncbi:MAG: decaprenyl-phosphate phosphoribosyltransferase [Gammaproteobacteria bacterium]|nr:MAG: decaprenyl-phosphate phosphoribosyltransferase [Gammaproteobacteria bacterium]